VHPTDDESYRWVAPPADRAAANVAPEGRVASVPAGSAVDSVWTPDLQVVLRWQAGSLAPGEATSIEVTPLDPADLEPLPGAQEPDGNAYRIELAPAPEAPLVLQLRVPHDAEDLWWSADGTSWSPLATPVDAAEPEPGTELARLPAPGYVLAGADLDPSSWWWPEAAVVTWSACALAACVVLVRRLR
jgi:hypothetical protein